MTSTKSKPEQIRELLAGDPPKAWKLALETFNTEGNDLDQRDVWYQHFVGGWKPDGPVADSEYYAAEASFLPWELARQGIQSTSHRNWLQKELLAALDKDAPLEKNLSRWYPLGVA